MQESVDLYDSHYAAPEDEVYRAVRVEAFGVDLGQASWIDAAECDAFAELLELRARQDVLEVACGTGGVAARFAEVRGVSVIGVDVNDAAVAAATARAGVSERLRFRRADADSALPFDDRAFHAVFCNDAINHFADRARVFAEWQRVLRPGGRCLFTDPVVVTGCVTKDELVARSSIGFFVFSAPGANEELLERAGFRVEHVQDVTENVERTSLRCLEARARRRDRLVELEGSTRFEEIQIFLETVHTLSSERRLSRLAFVAERQP